MKQPSRIRRAVAAALLALAAVLLLIAVLVPAGFSDAETAASRLAGRTESRLADLYSLCAQDPEAVPEDMVIYRYEEGRLVKWHNQFTVRNDGIDAGVVVHRLSNPRSGAGCPLADVEDSLGFFNFGPKWYLAKRFRDADTTVIAGLEITSTRGGETRTNAAIGIPKGFSVEPLITAGGAPVVIEGAPRFKLVDTSQDGSRANVLLVWAAFLLLLVGSETALSVRPTLKSFWAVFGVQLLASALMYLWGGSVGGQAAVFSPMLYTGPGIFYSLGAVILLNLVILLFALGLYVVRDDLFRKIRRTGTMVLFSVLTVAAVAGTLFYTHFLLKSIVLDSNITLEIYKLPELSVWTGVAYLSILSMLCCVPLAVQMLQPAFTRLLGHHFDALSTTGRLVYSCLLAAFVVAVSASHGLEKENSKMEIWANRLSVERDMMLELRLCQIEGPVSSDVTIASLATAENGALAIQGRIIENYLQRYSQDYEISVSLMGEGPEERLMSVFFNERLKGGVPLRENSRFFYISGGGSPRYDGVFMYFVEGAGLVRMLLEVEPRAGMSQNGYAGIFGLMRPGSVTLPKYLSYAKYSGADLQVCGGSCPYPYKLDDSLRERIYGSDSGTMTADGYVHHVQTVGYEEAVLLSRPAESVWNYIVSAIFIALLIFFLTSLTVLSRPREQAFEQDHYRKRISQVLMISLVLTLVALALVSVLFVYRRNESNQRTVMADKMSAIRSMMQSDVKGLGSTEDLLRMDLGSLLEIVGTNTSSDITLYSPDGLVMTSTSPEVFEMLRLGVRIDEHAYRSIIEDNNRYFIHKEPVDGSTFYSMYAPLTSEDGELLAIICSPYTEGESYSFERDAVMHSMTIITVFLILLLIARFATGYLVARMFHPLSVMSRKMNAADLDSPQIIEYGRKDEISSIVDAYNSMVTELALSSRRLAQAERDKAWSGMARQVAHEIKNPLTPMKLQIQRLIRLKQKGEPGWQEKFDEATKVILDHIDILTETANEFSDFAKLYTEEPTDINLDAILKEEIAMFDGRDDVSFDYMGLPDVVVSGPKPQLTRVFVNLITNAVQAVEGREDARVLVSLRNSTRDGFVDVVVEDNGPGVAPQNVGKLFTPNFTTKSAGSGLGLAISRSILDRCGATISYGRSFVLGGACFTVSYPRPQ